MGECTERNEPTHDRKLHPVSERDGAHETYQEIAEQLEIEGDWDEVYVQDQFNDDYEVRDIIEAFYDCMIEKVLNYIGAE